MKTQWILETHGEPVDSVCRFLQLAWTQLGLDGMLVPVNGKGSRDMELRVLNDPAQLDEVNPFRPLMTQNTARSLPELVGDDGSQHLGVLLRPCEMRALIEMVKHDSFRLARIVTICVDCLGTLPADEYQWRAERKGTHEALTQEALQFARQGGIVPYRYRPACQICSSPAAYGADLNINVLGLPVRQCLLIEIRDEAMAAQLHLSSAPLPLEMVYSPGEGVPEPLVDAELPAAGKLVAQRQRTVDKLVERRGRARERASLSLAETTTADVEGIIAMLEQCGSCQACMEACPICAVDFPNQDEKGRYVGGDVARWLISCSGCGMCEQACPGLRPLSAIFGYIRDQLAASAGYLPGSSVEDPLPLAWLSGLKFREVTVPVERMRNISKRTPTGLN